MTKPKNSSSFILLNLPFDSTELNNALDELLKSGLKSAGRGNRTDVQGVGALMIALYKLRVGGNRLKVAYLNKVEITNPEVITALEVLGVFKGILSKQQILEFKAKGELPVGDRESIIKASEYFLKAAVRYF